MTAEYRVIPDPPNGRAISPWSWVALTDAARETVIALYHDHRMLLHMVGDSARGPWVAWVVDHAARPWTVGPRVEGWDAEDVAYRAIQGALREGKGNGD